MGGATPESLTGTLYKLRVRERKAADELTPSPSRADPRAVGVRQVITMADARRSGLVMMINPQWQQGQVRLSFAVVGPGP